MRLHFDQMSFLLYKTVSTYEDYNESISSCLLQLDYITLH